MKKQIIAAIVGCLILSGCVTGWTGPEPMSKRWASDRRNQAELAERRKRIGPPLFGGKANRRDEEKPVTLIGSEDGLGAELQDTRGGILRYRFRW